ncbi:hypothetical protein RB195_006868 [Necator americanus]|uniref:Uncharacterized protein n=1 Tax=Necator americanus TaxID=51031 RepID=A0ABR1BY87_NECAM
MCRGVQHQPKPNFPGLKDDGCRKKFRQGVSINIGLQTKKRVDDADSFTKCIQDAAKKTLLVSTPKKNASASAETRPTFNSACVARTGDFTEGERLRRRLRRQLKRDRTNERQE